ncbi:MarR family winged helix-turn-helix transcriptional regulator [Nonomuraea roseoviolacea]|uniref:DNA-binding MarR family transcriptional regulator n=1 Tax=Nonomuraea roseoviolacea subsp. carminata TaxID=160689 RepID=A0ABT1KBU7_9ACTN|nr:MarR family transcriptional regulator [Nonomuraea roseoviolacea]MCP2351483.1 DNA-binding MarR family transcriptional regulator [Nonomuraea roseoviolacea subsp. carminata]
MFSSVSTCEENGEAVGGEPGPASAPRARAAGVSVTDLTLALEEFTRMFIRLPSVQRLSFTTLSVLHTLAGRGPQRLTALAAGEQVTQPAMTQMVTKLQRDGLVERRADPSDNRAVLVHLTAAGAAVVRGRRADRVAHLAELAAHLTPGEQAAITAALPALRRLVEADRRRQRESRQQEKGP